MKIAGEVAIQVTEPRFHFRTDKHFPGCLNLLMHQVSKFPLAQFLLSLEHHIFTQRLEVSLESCVFHSKQHFLQIKWQACFKPKSRRLIQPTPPASVLGAARSSGPDPNPSSKRRKTPSIPQDILDMKLPEGESLLCDSLLTRVAEALSAEVTLQRPDHNRVLLCVPLPLLCGLPRFLEIQSIVRTILDRDAQVYLNPMLGHLCFEWELLPVSLE